MGLLTDLQRSDPLTLDKFLHLPVSPSGVFLTNYVSSLFTITLVLFLAAAVGLLLGQLIAFGPLMLLAFPLLAGFVFAVTAVTYQFQGWLAVLMANPRRRRTIIVLLTLAVVVVAQTPNLFNMAFLGRKKTTTPPTLVTPSTNPAAPPPAKPERDKRDMDQVEAIARPVNVVLPPGWVPLGVTELAGGGVLPALLATAGFGLIGGLCLYRAYRTTVRFQTGQLGGSTVSAKGAAPTATTRPKRLPMVEWQLPPIPERVAAVATSTLSGLIRAPESKMLLLAPIIMTMVFGGMMFAFTFTVPSAARPAMAVAACAFVFVGGVQVAGNLFGYDRAGFRAFVLSPIPRRELLLGKNLGLAPLVLGTALPLALLVGCVYPMRPDHYPMVVCQLAVIYLLFCLLSNFLSVVAPIPMAAGAMKPSSVKLVPVLWQFGFMAVFPFAIVVALAPLGVEILTQELTGLSWLPIGVLLSALLLFGVWHLYRVVLTAQGNWLATREKDILLVVTEKAEG